MGRELLRRAAQTVAAGLLGAIGVTLSSGVGGATPANPGFCQAVAYLADSPAAVAAHWPTLGTKVPSAALAQALFIELKNIHSVLESVASAAPSKTLRGDYLRAAVASQSEATAVLFLNPAFNSSKTSAAMTKNLAMVHHQATLGATALRSAVSQTTIFCHSYSNNKLAQYFALNAATYSIQSANSSRPTRREIVTGAAESGHKVVVFDMLPASGSVTKVKYGVVIITRSVTVCVALPPTGIIARIIPC